MGGKMVGKYELGRTLGEGTFGKVKMAVDTESGACVAVKILDKEKVQQQNMGEQIKKEIAIMKLVKQRHVVNPMNAEEGEAGAEAAAKPTSAQTNPGPSGHAQRLREQARRDDEVCASSLPMAVFFGAPEGGRGVR